MRPATVTPSQPRHGVYASRPGSAYTGHSSANDPEIARLFFELRTFLGLSVPAAAEALATHPGVIAALEAGRIDLLPHWSETARVVSGYIQLAHLEPRPALDRLARRMGIVVTASSPQSFPAPAGRPRVQVTGEPDGPGTAVARILGRLSEAALRAQERARTPTIVAEWAQHVKETAEGVRTTVRGVRAPVRWVVAGALGLVVVASTAPADVLQASVSGLSQPITGLWRSLGGQATEVRVKTREGLKWIEVDDPRQRRTDKLPTPRT